MHYANLRLAQAKIGTRGETTVKVDVTNTGKLKGDEVVQMYIRDLVSSITRPSKELKGFRRITLKPGATETVEFPITSEALSFLDGSMNRVVEPGAFDVMVAPNATELRTMRLDVE